MFGRDEVFRRDPAQRIRGDGDVRGVHRGQIGEHARDVVQEFADIGVDDGDDVPHPVREVGESVILRDDDNRVVLGVDRRAVLVVQNVVVPILVERGTTGVGDDDETELAFVGRIGIGEQPFQLLVSDQSAGRQPDNGDVFARSDLRERLRKRHVEVVGALGDRLGQGEAVISGKRPRLLGPTDLGVVVTGECAAEYCVLNQAEWDVARYPVDEQPLVGGEGRRCRGQHDGGRRS